MVETTDWKIVPIENLLARGARVFVEAADMEEARIASSILETGTVLDSKWVILELIDRGGMGEFIVPTS